MAGDRAFDDGRWSDQEGLSECFLCGRAVDLLDPNRGTYEEPPAGPQLNIHLGCVDAIQGRPGLMRKTVLSIEYHKALNTMADRQFKVLRG